MESLISSMKPLSNKSFGNKLKIKFSSFCCNYHLEKMKINYLKYDKFVPAVALRINICILKFTKNMFNRINFINQLNRGFNFEILLTKNISF